MKLTVSPAQFIAVQESIQRLEAQGYSPDAVAYDVLRNDLGVRPKDIMIGENYELVVDWMREEPT